MTSPFADDRFEIDAEHYFYLPRDCLLDLERHKPLYLIGSRGSGKTTLLMSLNSHERINNSTLLRQLGNDPFRGLIIGTYVKLPKIQLGSFNNWLVDVDDDIHGILLGLYFDLVFLETISHAVSDMLAEGTLKISSNVESDSVSVWVADCADVLVSSDFEDVTSVASFNRLVRSARRSLEHLALTRASVNESLEQFAPGQIGTLGTAVARRMADLCNHDTLGKDGKWHFKVCMDEGECLTDFQQVVVNTIVRLAEWPLFPVVSYVRRPEDITTTLVPNITLQKADRKLILLDTMEMPEFIELAEGVASVRCQEELDDPSVVFDSNVTLGRLNINGLLAKIIEKSESPKAATFVDEATDFASRTGAKAEKGLPIYQAYLATKLSLPVKSLEGREQERHLESQQYRKKMVAAFLSICRELKVRHVPYASAEMVFEISDNCVRDFLSQIDHIFRESNLELKQFLRTEIAPETQHKAIRAASDEKRASIPDSGVLSPVETGRVVKGLAMVTGMIQSFSDDDRHLRSTERGLFRLAGEKSQLDMVKQAMKLVCDAAEAGFLRIFDKGESVQFFRVHASLAPSYGFSYRGAYYAVKLTLDDFNRLKDARTETELASVAKSIAKRLPTETDQLSLFPDEEEADE
ncbi:MAG: hypothetical protein IID44_04995 [Planctomycetes bacterium]|nr:hypothetical protein [Planctomycetota bacterium]